MVGAREEVSRRRLRSRAGGLMVRHEAVNLGIAGSNPARLAKVIHGVTLYGLYSRTCTAIVNIIM